MKLKQNNIIDVDGDLTILFKVVDKLEKRIATLEKVLQSHIRFQTIRELKNGS